MKRERNTGIMPLQPYIVMTSNRYRHIMEQRYGISHFYEFTVNEESKKQLQAVPDGSVDLLFGISANSVHTYLGGTVLKAKDWDLSVGENYFGIRFLPGKCILPDNVSIKDIINTDIELSGERQTRELSEQIAEAGSLEQRAEIFLKTYAGQFEKQEEKITTRQLEDYISRRIYETKGNIAISDLSVETGYSESYIRRIFGQIHGVSPKTFEKFVRFQTLLRDMNDRENGIRQEELALLYGYYDQAHMIKEFKLFTGVTPENYIKKIAGTHFADNIHQ